MDKEKFAKYFTVPDYSKSKKRGKEEVKTIYEALNIDEKMKLALNNKKYFIRTYGCQMNEHDTEVMQGMLEQAGMNSTTIIEEADVIIFNTCAIRENAENKVFGEIGRLKGLKLEDPDKIFAVCGCMSQEEGVVNRLLTTYTWIDMIFGTHNIHRLPELLSHAIFDKEKVIEVWSNEGEIIEDLPKIRNSKTSAWVNIIYGCDKFCTYCIVPFTRGKERSRDPKDIVKEVQDLVNDGYKEVTLLGQNVNSYAKDLNIDYSLADLLQDVSDTGIKRLRFTTSHPWDFTDEMIEKIGSLPNVMPHIHLPVQSGNNEILKIMGRGYTRESYLEIIEKLKKLDKPISFTTDIIVGFPNETEEQFLDTISLYEIVQYDNAFTFVYSQREGTPAAKMQDNISIEDKKNRLYKLNEVVNKYANAANDKLIGTMQEVLIIGKSNKNPNFIVGYSGGNKLVLVEADEKYIGEIINVEITEAHTMNLTGSLINE